MEVGDMFCSKCGTKVEVATAPAKGGVAVARKTISKSALKPGLKLPGKKVLVVPAQKRKPMTLVVNGACRYCGKSLDASATVCPDCGARSEKQIALDNRPVAMEDVKRAVEINNDLGSRLDSPIHLLNPFLSEARDALERGDLDLAKELNDKSNKFYIAVLIMILAIVGIL